MGRTPALIRQSTFLLFCFFILTASRLNAGDPVWFSHGLVPIKTGPLSHKMLSVKDCRSCHKKEYEDWSHSGLAKAWTDPLFQEGFQFEKVDRCIYCHAPLQEQFQGLKQLPHGSLAREGVNCAACHVREDQVYPSDPAVRLPHLFQNRSYLKESRFCAGCHQFNFSAQLQGKITTQNLASQNTYREWLSYKAHGGTQTCQNCHMPEGRHIFIGPHDPDYLSKALTVKIVRLADGYLFKLKPNGVGHRFPTGDVFRRLTVEIAKPGQDQYKVIASFGRVFKNVQDSKTGHIIQKLVSDTTLDPFEEKNIRLAWKGPFQYRVRYHFTSEYFEWRSLLRSADLSTTLISGVE
jgi:hypothetical protein